MAIRLPAIVLSVSVFVLSAGAAMAQERSQVVPDRQVIAAVQQKLKQSGYNIRQADGIPGTDTRNSVILYQSNKGLRPTGQIDLSTISSLGLDINLASASQAAAQQAALEERQREEERRRLAALQARERQQAMIGRGGQVTEGKFDEDRYDPVWR